MALRPGRGTWCCWMVSYRVAWQSTRQLTAIHKHRNHDMAESRLWRGNTQHMKNPLGVNYIP